MIWDLVYNGFLIFGVRFVTLEGEILGIPEDNPLPEFVQKPLYSCVKCMPSIWGTAYYLLQGLEYNYPLYLLTLVGYMWFKATVFDWLKR